MSLRPSSARRRFTRLMSARSDTGTLFFPAIASTVPFLRFCHAELVAGEHGPHLFLHVLHDGDQRNLRILVVLTQALLQQRPKIASLGRPARDPFLSVKQMQSVPSCEVGVLLPRPTVVNLALF